MLVEAQSLPFATVVLSTDYGEVVMIGPWIAWLIALGPAVVVAPFAVFTLYVHRRLRSKGVQVQADCEHYYWSKEKHFLQYRYADQSERSHVRLANLSFPVSRAKRGRPLEVVYDSARPSRSRSRHELRRPIPWEGVSIGIYLFVQLVCGILGGVFLATGLFDR
ncbi:DUF3592 domain-containing protein [Streptomyces agglomeratus]|uniref:DUF3592 domain-containing protein n=1 Tax=Streptomyces agglomeratus TaxID=285458 RepID=UPI00114CBD5B|nr:DUF3592 domain-containing protein [Streptomyces agglomeratus]